MSDIIYYLMTNFTNQIVFLHVFSAVIWVGAMASSRYGRVKPLRTLTEPEEFMFETQRYTKFFKLMTPFVIILFVTALIMALSFHDNAYDEDGFIHSQSAVDLLKFVHTKGAVWIIMAMNMGLMAWINYNAAKSFSSCSNLKECERCKEALEIIYNYLMPVNIILGTVEIAMGVILRHAY